MLHKVVFLLILGDQHYTNTKTRQGHHRKRKPNTRTPLKNNTDEHRYKNPQQSISKLNSTTFKESHIMTEISFRNARMVQHKHIIQSDKPH